MKRLVVVGLVLIALVAVFHYDVGRWLIDARGWLGITLNSNGTSTDVYQSLSGLIPALAILGLLASAVGAGINAYRHHNCNHAPCHRFVGTVLTKNGHRLCKEHIGWPNEKLDIHEIHPDHQ